MDPRGQIRGESYEAKVSARGGGFFFSFNFFFFTKKISTEFKTLYWEKTLAKTSS